MIVVVGRVTSDADKRAELIRIGQKVAAASRREAGCIGYTLNQDTESENDFVFVEEWASMEALKEHFATPHIAEFMGAITATLVTPPDVKFHTVESSLDITEVASA